MYARYGKKWPVNKIKFARSDNGGEFISDEITFDESEEGFEMQPSVVYAHNQSGVTTHIISILYEAGLPKKL